MDPPKSRQSCEQRSPASAPRTPGKQSASPPPLLPPPASPACSVLVQGAAATGMPRSKAGEKAASSQTEYALVAARLSRKRMRARHVRALDAPASRINLPAAGNRKLTSAASGIKLQGSPDAPMAECRGSRQDSANSTVNALEPPAVADVGGNPDATKPSREPLLAGGRGDGHYISPSAREPPLAGGRCGGYCTGGMASYKRISILGEGGFGTVCKARQIHTGELVAIKSGKTSSDGTALLSEAALHFACRGNPYVVRLREVVYGHSIEDVHLIMDYPGVSLRKLIDVGRMGPRFTESETCQFMKQLVMGVDAMRCHGIVHGDLKPENILISKKGGRLMICDLGLAVPVAAPPRNIEGTLWYAAPEQLLGENCGPAVDAWALGCIMAELLTGQPLVRADHPTEQLMNIICLLAVPDNLTQLDFGVDESTSSELREKGFGGAVDAGWL